MYPFLHVRLGDAGKRANEEMGSVADRLKHMKDIDRQSRQEQLVQEEEARKKKLAMLRARADYLEREAEAARAAAAEAQRLHDDALAKIRAREEAWSKWNESESAKAREALAAEESAAAAAKTAEAAHKYGRQWHCCVFFLDLCSLSKLPLFCGPHIFPRAFI